MTSSDFVAEKVHKIQCMPQVNEFNYQSQTLTVKGKSEQKGSNLDLKFSTLPYRDKANTFSPVNIFLLKKKNNYKKSRTGSKEKKHCTKKMSHKAMSSKKMVRSLKRKSKKDLKLDLKEIHMMDKTDLIFKCRTRQNCTKKRIPKKSINKKSLDLNSVASGNFFERISSEKVTLHLSEFLNTKNSRKEIVSFRQEHEVRENQRKHGIFSSTKE